MARLSENERARVRQMIASAKAWYEIAQAIPEGDADRDVFTDQPERNLALLNGTYWSKRRPDLEMKKVNNLLWAWRVKNRLVTGGEVHFIATARQQRYMAVQETADGLLNHQWDSLDFSRQTKRAAWDRGVYRYGVVEIGWRYQDDKRNLEGERPDALTLAEEALAENPDAHEINPAVPQTFNPELEQPLSELQTPEAQAVIAAGAESPTLKRRKPLVDDPFVERFCPADLLIDPACTNYTLDDANFVFRRKLVPVVQVKAKRGWSVPRTLKGNTFQFYKKTGSDSNRVTNSEPRKDVKDELMLLEIYDGDVRHERTGKLRHIVWCPEAQKELFVDDTPYPHWRMTSPYRFEIIPGLVVDNDTVYPASDVTNVRDQQVCSDEAYTKVENQRRRTNNVLLAGAGVFSGPNGKEIRDRIEGGIEDVVVELDEQIVTGRLAWLPPPPLHEDSLREMAAARDEMMQHMGISTYQANMMPRKQVTATEASTLSTQGAAEQDEEAGVYHDFLERIAYKVLTLDQEWIERTREYAYTDATGKVQFGTVDVMSLRGMREDVDIETTLDQFESLLEPPGIQFAVNLDASRVMPKNQYLERKELVGMMGIMAKYGETPDPNWQGVPGHMVVNMPALIRAFAAKFDLPNLDEIVPDPPTPEDRDKLTQMALTAEATARLMQQTAAQQIGGAGQGPPMMPGNSGVSGGGMPQ